MKRITGFVVALCLMVPVAFSESEGGFLVEMMSTIGERYALTQRPAQDNWDFEAGGMRFHAEAYDADGLGFVSQMTAENSSGQRVIETLIVNPFELDAPLLSFDAMAMGGNDTYVMELYRTTLENAFSTERMEALVRAIPSDENPGEHWYDDVLQFFWRKTADHGKADQNIRLVQDCMAAYLDETANAPACDPELKRKAAAAYTESLLANGGPATDLMRASLGEEATAALLRDVLFGTGIPD